MDGAIFQSRTESTNRPRTPQPVHDPHDDGGQPHQLEDATQPVIAPDPLELEAASSLGSIPVRITSRLFLSHFLSTWNSRLFEMGAVLFIAAIYPNTLRPMSIYALVRNGAAIVLSPALGSWIDKGNRLSVVRISIVGQRLAVASSCGIFWFLLVRKEIGSGLKSGLFTLTVALACIEKLCSVMNLVSVERDWVVIISEGKDAVRQKLNARMRRIDLFCKLCGPLVISLIDGASTLVATWVTLAMSCTSVLIEYFAIAAVFRLVPALQRPEDPNTTTMEGIEPRQPAIEPSGSSMPRRLFSFLLMGTAHLLPLNSFPYYFQHPAFLPSFALSLLYLTVLSFSGQMITFLLSVGYTSIYVGVTRTISTVFELSATWIAPKIQRHVGAVRGGIWFLTWQMLWLAGGLSWYFASGAPLTGHEIFAASGLVGTVILSRIGLWGFDLCAQSIVQEEVDEHTRGAFSSVEASFQNLFELLSYMTTVVFSRTDQFQWPVIISVIAVYAAAGTYAIFVRRRRGHLIHVASCMKR